MFDKLHWSVFDLPAAWYFTKSCVNFCFDMVEIILNSILYFYNTSIYLSVYFHYMSGAARKRTFGHVWPVRTPISLRIRAVWSESSLSAWRNSGSLTIIERPAKTQISLRIRAGWSESSLGACVQRYVFSLCGPYYWVDRISQNWEMYTEQCTFCHVHIELFSFVPLHEKRCLRFISEQKMPGSTINLAINTTSARHLSL